MADQTFDVTVIFTKTARVVVTDDMLSEGESHRDVAEEIGVMAASGDISSGVIIEEDYEVDEIAAWGGDGA